jgi:hypothetical protein
MNRRLSVGASRRLPTALRFHNLRSRTGLAAAVMGALLICLPAARAADLSKDIRTADNEDQYTSEIASYVQGQTAVIASDADPAQSSRARENLLDNVRGLVAPSPAFLDSYEAQLNQSLGNLLAPANSIRVRLNAAIVVAEVAGIAQDAQMSQLVVKELNDPSEAVVLWGLKAAREVIPPALGVPSLKVQLIKAVLGAIFRLPASGPVVSAGYNALAVGDKPNQSPVDLIAPIQRVLDWRIKQYATGIPPEPPADAIATSFLTERVVWTQAPAQQIGTAQRIVNLVVAATTALPTALDEDHDEVILLLRKTGENIYVIGINDADPALQAACTPLAHVDLRPPPLPPLQAAKAAIAGLVAKFPGLKVPAGFATAAAPAPSAAPAAPATPATP